MPLAYDKRPISRLRASKTESNAMYCSFCDQIFLMTDIYKRCPNSKEGGHALEEIYIQEISNSDGK